MAYVNVAEWKPDQVTEWLKGLDNSILSYIHAFLNNQVNGQQLLSFGPNDLEHLGVHKIGHQEIILEGIEHLRNIHYELDRENLQLLAMRLSCLAHSLHNELCHSHSNNQRLSTQILADISTIVTAVKPLIAWLDRPGFSGEPEYRATRGEVLSLALRMATCGQRDRFVEAPVSDMKDASAQLAKRADTIVQDMTDPLIIQPASLDLATIKKRSSDDLGFYIVPSFRGIHQISDLKLNSAAHQSGKIEPGDEIIQINYQTVVGWNVKQVMNLFAESPTEVLLTLKKRPRHTKVYGQIYVKPYRLPTKKRAVHSHAFTPRPELLTMLHYRVPIHSLKMPSTNLKKKTAEESRDTTSSDEEVVTVQHNLVMPSKPVHRRATITGASPLSKRPPFDIHELWHEMKLEKESSGKQSTTSVIDFEERLSSVDRGSGSVPVPGAPGVHPDQEAHLETLTIKQKIEMFSQQKQENKIQPPPRAVKPQIRFNSEPIFDKKSLSDANRVSNKLKEQTTEIMDVKNNLSIISKNNMNEQKENGASTNIEIKVAESRVVSDSPRSSSVLSEETKLKSVHEGNVESEEHGQIVQTINKHLLMNKLSDDSDVHEFPVYEPKSTKTDNMSTNSLPLDSKSKGGECEPRSYISTHSLPTQIEQASLSKECVSELSRTISKVITEDIITKDIVDPHHFVKSRNVQHFDQPPPKHINKKSRSIFYDKSYSIESIDQVHNAEQRALTRNELSHNNASDQDNAYKYNSLQDRHLRGHRDNYDSASTKSYSSSDYSEQSGLETLPKTAAAKQTPPVPPPRPSLSKPPSACYRAIMAARSLGKASPKAHRKKHPLLSKGRKVGVKDFPCVECEGWLLQRCRKGPVTWNRRWCLIHSNALYTFQSKQGTKAETFVCLPGFTASPAEEVKSRPYAFKVYHTGTMFYFAAETNFELSVWLDAITSATLGPNPNTKAIVYSESEGEEKVEPIQNVARKGRAPPTPAPRPHQPSPPNSGDSSKMFGSLKKLGGGSGGGGGGSSLDRKCLRLLGPAPQPVPTAHYRSYRRVHNTSTSCSGRDGEEQNSDLHHSTPPDMADYRLAALTAKTTPPVPRRRMLTRDPVSNESRRPHISAPILNQPVFDDRSRRLPPALNNQSNMHPQGQHPLQPPHTLPSIKNPIGDSDWVDSLRRAQANRKKIKTKKPSNHVSSPVIPPNNIHCYPNHPLEHPHPTYRSQVSEVSTPPDYPGLEYPPVFEPGTYTLDTSSVLRTRTLRNHPS